MRITSVAILGAGATGSYVIWGLSGAENVRLGVVADGARAERLRQNGCHINGEIYRPEVWTPEEAHGVDLLIVCLKYGMLPGALADIEKVVSENTIVMSLMNGIDSEEIIAARIGSEHMIYSLIKIASCRDGNEYRFHPETTPGIILGEVQAPSGSERIHALEALFHASKVRYTVTDHILEEMWSKFRLNVCDNLPQAILGVGLGCYRDSEHMQAIQSGLQREVEAIAAARGIQLPPMDLTGTHGIVVPPSTRYSTLQDLDAGRHTEVDMFSGVLMHLGQELGIAVPYNEYTYHMIKAIEERAEGRFDY